MKMSVTQVRPSRFCPLFFAHRFAHFSLTLWTALPRGERDAARLEGLAWRYTQSGERTNVGLIQYRNNT